MNNPTKSSTTARPTDTTNNPTSEPTTNPTERKISAFESRQIEFEPQLDDLTNLFQTTFVTFTAMCTFIGLSAIIDAKKFRINDYFKIGAITSMFIQTIDMLSDCFFVAQICVQNKIDLRKDYEIIFILSIIFIVAPAMTALFQLYFYAKKYWLENDHVRAWISKFSTLLLFLSVITGSSFAAVSLLNSYIFQLDVFDMGLPQKQLKGFNTKRVYSIVLMEVYVVHIECKDI